MIVLEAIASTIFEVSGINVAPAANDLHRFVSPAPTILSKIANERNAGLIGNSWEYHGNIFSRAVIKTEHANSCHRSDSFAFANEITWDRITREAN